MRTTLQIAAPAASASPVVSVSLTLLFIAIGITLCMWVGHRWSTLIIGVIIGLFLTGTFAEGTKSTVTTVVTSTINSVSKSVK